ncbi:MAG TPA: YceI family protein [Thermoanaerobaculia bacterium]|nr:YceI family protein [Thermoanaerobaculia bacterium]
MPIPAQIARKSEAWFRKHQRKLPWRAHYDPYCVWLSEVMLQQTQMPVVLRYYKRFLDRFPTIADLAAASHDDVTAAWSGLGYYRRARMLRDGAIAVRDRFEGRLPDDVGSLMTIPGIGRYTAGAIASIAYNRVAPIVDGNIARIVTRLYGNDRNRWGRAEALVRASASPRIFNQALMEIGALICRPRNPWCDRCPLRTECRAFARGRTALAPRKRPESRTLRRRLYILRDRRGRILMRRDRRGMFVLVRRLAVRGRFIGTFRHTIMNQRITFEVFAANRQPQTPNCSWIDTRDLNNIPHPSFVRKALQLAGAMLLAATSLFAESRSYEIKPDAKNVAEFHAEDSYDAFDGKTNKLTGAIVADPANPSAATVEIKVDMASLDTANSLRNREMRELYLETRKYPTSSFKSVSVEAPASIAPNQPADIKVTGDFSLHGVTKRMTIPVRVVLIPDGRIHATSLFQVHMPDFGIHVPKNILVTVNDEVPVRLDLWAAAK